MAEEKLCSKCSTVKPTNEFAKNKNRADGLNGWCKGCVRNWYLQHRQEQAIKAREWAHTHLDVRKAIVDRYYDNHRERIRHTSQELYKANLESARLQSRVKRHRLRKCNGHSDFAEEQWSKLVDGYGPTCLCCGEPKPLTVDHVVPVSKGGSNDISNIQPLCKSCNGKKHDKTIDYRPDHGEFARSLLCQQQN